MGESVVKMKLISERRSAKRARTTKAVFSKGDFTVDTRNEIRLLFESLDTPSDSEKQVECHVYEDVTLF